MLLLLLRVALGLALVWGIGISSTCHGKILLLWPSRQGVGQQGGQSSGWRVLQGRLLALVAAIQDGREGACGEAILAWNATAWLGSVKEGALLAREMSDFGLELLNDWD